MGLTPVEKSCGPLKIQPRQIEPGKPNLTQLQPAKEHVLCRLEKLFFKKYCYWFLEGRLSPNHFNRKWPLKTHSRCMAWGFLNIPPMGWHKMPKTFIVHLAKTISRYLLPAGIFLSINF